MEQIEDFLLEQEEKGLLRRLRPMSARSGVKIRIGDKDYLDFSSNDYLGLAGHPRLVEAAQAALKELGTASSASRLLSGDFNIHHQLEEEVAKFKQKEAALVFNSGYQANLGILSALYGKGDCIFSDRLNHASIIDGIKLCGARFFRFQHNDAGHLKSLLIKERANFRQALIVSETIFSMDGDRCPLKALVELKDRYNCRLMLDEAHATGIFGPNGSGLAEEEEVSAQVDLIMGTFSKGLGSFGAYLASSRKIIDYLVNTCRSFIYSTALPPVVVASNLEAIALIKDEPLRRKKLLEDAQYFRNRLGDKGLRVLGDSQIVPLVIGDNLKTVELAQALQERAFWALPIRPPTVPNGQARIRFSLSYNHQRQDLERLVSAIIELAV